MLRIFSLITIISLIAFSSYAETEKKTSIDGVQRISNKIQIFPENKASNTAYKNKKKVVSVPSLTLIGISEASDGYIYMGKNESDQKVLGFSGNPEVEFIPLNGGFYQLIIRKKLTEIYWINQNGEIENLLPRSKTANGLVFNNVDKSAFYNISKGETVETEEGRERFQYTFKIHIANTKTFEIKHLKKTVSDFRSRLRLQWVDENTLQYKLSNGNVEAFESF